MSDPPVPVSRAVDEVAADTEDLASFVKEGGRYVGRLTELYDRIDRSRTAVVAEIGDDGPLPGVASPYRASDQFGDLIERVRTANAFADEVHSALGDARGLELSVAPTGTSAQLVGRGNSEAPGDVGPGPEPRDGVLAYPLYVGSQGALATSVTSDWVVRVQKQSFHPRRAGMWVGRHGFPRWQWAALAVQPKHWIAKPNQAANVARWRAAGRWAGRTGTATVLVSSGWSEWQASGGDPTVSTSERVGRTATVAAATAAGSWGGVWAGSQVGAGIGTFICPGVGTVAGGFVGGFAGGVAGGYGGERLGAEVKEFGGDFVDGTVGLVEDAGDVVADVGDAVMFWD